MRVVDQTKQTHYCNLGDVVSSHGFFYLVIKKSDNSYGYLSLDEFLVQSPSYEDLQSLNEDNLDAVIVDSELILKDL